MTLLEAVDWITESLAVWKRGKLPDKRPALRDLKVTDLQATEGPANSEAVERLFAGLPSMQWLHVDGRMRSVVEGATRDEQDSSAQQAYTLLQTQDGRKAFEQTARSYVLSKAGRNAHHYKYWSAAFENARHVSPEWRPNYLAASAHYCFGPKTPDNGLIRRATRG